MVVGGCRSLGVWQCTRETARRGWGGGGMGCQLLCQEGGGVQVAFNASTSLSLYCAVLPVVTVPQTEIVVWAGWGLVVAAGQHPPGQPAVCCAVC